MAMVMDTMAIIAATVTGIGITMVQDVTIVIGDEIGGRGKLLTYRSLPSAV